MGLLTLEFNYLGLDCISIKPFEIGIPCIDVQGVIDRMNFEISEKFCVPFYRAIEQKSDRKRGRK